MSHTPGPWRWMNLGGTWHLCRADSSATVVLSTVVGETRWDGDSPETIVLAVRDRLGHLVPLAPDHPDARLIAAAPDLLAACEALASYVGIDENMTEERAEAEGQSYANLFRLSRAAFVKAKGQS